MEYVEGETLADVLARGPVEPRRAVEIVRAVAAALDHAHASGIVHRDIKPANILLGRDGSVKLADLGIAKAVERTDITDTGTVLGTPVYMAPEQLQGGELGPAVDIYALATMAFELLTGRKARSGRAAVEIAHKVVNEPAPDPREVNPRIPGPAADAIRAGMARDPVERPRSAGELADRLESARPIAPVPVQEPPGTRPMHSYTTAPRRSPRWTAALALGALAVAALAIALASGGGGDEGAADRARAEDERGAAVAAEDQAETAAAIPEPGGAGGSAAAEQLHLEGHAALQAGDYDTAIELNTRAIEAFPEGTTWETDMNYAYALYSLGRALRLAGRPDEAIPVLELRSEIPDQTATVQQELDLARQEAAE
jgi:serine/threonine-protein kinase